MRCEDVLDQFHYCLGLSEDDQNRIEVEAHLLDCQECAVLFGLCEENEELIQQISEETADISLSEHVTRNVMDRIYAEQSWLMPVPSKSYQFSRSFKRNISLLIAGCMAMFACALFVFVSDYNNAPSQEDLQQLTGLLDTANASEENAFLSAGFYAEVPVASISDPFVLKVVPTFPQYYVALSLLGIVMAMLILNWLTRTRS